ncbi:FAD-dependent oxidoreductase [Microbacterium halotolerans]|uniref:FAD-dependent oxidoreductase n=1 Tax=Microbacterium halotolerans TaxID=246613 RepID=UPI000E6A9CB2|nr:FAD-dependent oxidoreductase [Microbacterium halotolerans]
MIGSLRAWYLWAVRLLGRASMYRLTLFALASLVVVAFIASAFGLLAATPASIALTAVVLVIVGSGVDMMGHRLRGTPWRAESTLITAGILLFVLRPGTDAATLAGAAVGAAIAVASKHLVSWRGRHLLNPAAAGATGATLVALAPWISGGSAWWVGSPVMFVPVLLAGFVVLWRTERVRVVALFFLVAVVVSVVRTIVQLNASGASMALDDLLTAVIVQSPYLFLGAFMLSEPLTQPPRRWQQYIVALIVGALAGWPVSLGVITLGQERALLIGNLVALCFAARSAVRLTLADAKDLTPTVRELSLTVAGGIRFVPGQYLELEVPHRGADARGTRREFSIASAPEELPELRIAYRAAGGLPPSTYKAALARAGAGEKLRATGVWGDFVLPRDAEQPLLLVAAGIGITPFVSQLRHRRIAGRMGDIVIVYVASTVDELAYRDELERAGVRVHIVTPDDPGGLPEQWTWQSERLTGTALADAVPGLDERRAYVSGPPGLIAGLAPTLRRARSVTTDAFAGY